MTLHSHVFAAASFARRCSMLCLLALLGACATVEAPPASPDPVTDDVSDIVAAAASAAASAPKAVHPNTATEAPAVAVPIDPLRPDERVDLNDATANTDLWVRLRRGFAIPDLDTPLVQNREQWYATRPDYVQRMTTRGGRYLYHIVEEVERRGMPTELALLPFVESAFNPQALSSAKASGMWQFMPATGKHFELRQNVFRDDRRDVLASTRAALDYLSKLYGMFGDWHLALAAYNWGEGSVQRAIAKNRRAGLPTDYLSLRMPEETRYYVPKLQAVKNIVARPEAFGLRLPTLDNHPYFLSVPIERDIDVALAIELSDVKREEFMTLNPQMNKPVILAAGTPQVLLPYHNAALFIDKVRNHRGQLATWTAWVAPSTMRPSDVAQRVGMTEAQLREVNAIPPSMLVNAGSTLLVPRSHRLQDDVPGDLADNATLTLSPDAPPLRRVALKAGRRDSVASIAKRYRVSAAQVAQWNKTTPHASFQRGQAIVVYVAAKASRGTRHAHAIRQAAPAAKQVSTQKGKAGAKTAKAPARKANQGAAKRSPATHQSQRTRSARR